jgi:pSer/pThr/pTyr-binding forkhead associated (FHA) protein/S1-C subfamily serine protease
MAYLRLTELGSGASREFHGEEVRIGRHPELELALRGPGSDVVSAHHARFVFRAARWWIEDLGSRNGTYLGERQLSAGAAEPLEPGSIVGLGRRGPRFRIDSVADAGATVREPEAAAPPIFPSPAPKAAPPPSAPIAPAAVVKLVLEDARSGARYEARAPRVRIGRGRECEIRPLGGDDQLLSRVHSEIELKTGGRIVVRDCHSANGTYLNGEYLECERELAQGDQIALGEDGPVLVVEKLSVSVSGEGLTSLIIRRIAEDVSRRSTARLRRVVWSFVALLAVLTSALFMLAERRERETSAVLEAQRRQLEEQRQALEDYRRALAAQQATTDSVLWAATTENQRLRTELMGAVASSAPAATVDSLRLALGAAEQRTEALEASLARSQAALARQLAAGDSLRRQADAEVARLRTELERARGAQLSAALVDSLRRAIQDAERQAADIGAQLRAVSGVNLAALAQANQGAVGLVTVFRGVELFDGSGFAITPSGHFVTNRHVVRPGGSPADSLFVTMADQRYMELADVVAVAEPGGPDLALLRIRNYSGAHIARVDWSGSRAHQGEPAALIGFPAGIGAALDQSRTVRTSMSAGIFSKVTADLIQFDGFTVEGSSGSPVFNAQGEVVAVHRGSLRGATGLGFAVPIGQLLTILPPALRAELGPGS